MGDYQTICDVDVAASSADADDNETAMVMDVVNDFVDVADVIDVQDTAADLVKDFNSAIMRKCIIHCDACTDDIHSNLTSPRDVSSWNVLLRAAHIRQLLPIIELSAELTK